MTYTVYELSQLQLVITQGSWSIVRNWYIRKLKEILVENSDGVNDMNTDFPDDKQNLLSTNFINDQFKLLGEQMTKQNDKITAVFVGPKVNRKSLRECL